MGLNILSINWQDITNPQAGGAEVHITEILKRVVKRGHKATLFCSGYAGAPKEEVKDGIKIIRRGSRFNFNWILPFYLPQVLEREEFDIVLEDINKLPFFSPLYHQIPTLVIVHHFFGRAIFKEVNFLFGMYVLLGEKLIPVFYRNFPFLTISESTKNELIKKNIAGSNINVISNGISNDLFETGSGKTDYPLILYLGRIKKYKSIDHLILAFELVRKKIQTARLIIAGSGDYVVELKQQIRELHLENYVSFKGFVSEKEKVVLLQQAWVSVYPSLKEGWGLTNIEAGACGTPVIASDVPGLRDSVLPGKTGFLYEYGNIKELCECLLKILSDEKLREWLGDNGKKWAGNFSWDATADKCLELIEEVARQKSRIYQE